jgi:hypothetical protein
MVMITVEKISSKSFVKLWKERKTRLSNILLRNLLHSNLHTECIRAVLEDLRFRQFLRILIHLPRIKD